MLITIWAERINPLSLNSDHHQISPCNINGYSTPEVMRIKDMKLLPSTLIRKVWGQDRRICSLILGVKGLHFPPERFNPCQSHT